VRAGVRLQDALASFVVPTSTSQAFVGIVCDGAGSAAFGGEGASLVVRSLTTLIRRKLSEAGKMPSAEDFGYWIDNTRDRISLVASRRNSDPREFAATLVCVVSTGEETIVAHVGDGCAVLRLAASQRWIVPSWPFHGEYASTTAFVTDQPEVKLNTEIVTESVSDVVLFSDGLERIALDFKSRMPHPGFLDVIARPLSNAAPGGRDSTLSRSLGEFLESERINSRTDDDKSLIVASQR
jgi:hypothetical protein